MAKNRFNRGGRGLLTPSRPLAISLPRVAVSPVDLRVFEDRRTFHPDGPLRRPLALPQSAGRVFENVNKKSRSRSSARTFSPGVLTFAAPDRVVLCVRRQRRKEVLHALRKTGKVGQRKPRRNFWSRISCKR